VRPISIGTGVELLDIFWPEFFEIDGCVLVSTTNDPAYTLNAGYNRTETEAFLNHFHIADDFNHKAERESANDANEYFDDAHPDFQLLCKMGKAVAQMWFRKLSLDFPAYDFRVYYTQYDNPIVRFHRVRPDERNWIEDDDPRSAEAVAYGEMVIYDTRAEPTKPNTYKQTGRKLNRFVVSQRLGTFRSRR